ncbi:MAG TPA: ornithine cyclodeaminase family protein [Gemmatimonadaceae bacterium]|nr:ornithine cyclodeaminase family protein [Gemmatimonadaceae bacterium]
MSPPGNRIDQHAGTLVFTRADVRRLLTMPECIDAVEDAFRRHADGHAIPPGVVGTHVDGGGFHVKTAGLHAMLPLGQPAFVMKVNANFPGNPDRNGLPTIQGVVALFDASNGRVLALMDSMEITSIRTAAATAVAARYLAVDEPAIVTICGCGEQSRHQLRALACVRTLRRVYAFDAQPGRARSLATEMGNELGVEAVAVDDLGAAARQSGIVVTCTPSHEPIVGPSHVVLGTFVAAVGADNPAKSEIEPALMATSTVVTDLTDQCVAIGDLHHAIAAGAMRASDVHAELAEVICGRKPSRRSASEIIVFDSTGTALQDVAAATVVYRNAIAAKAGMLIDLAGEAA